MKPRVTIGVCVKNAEATIKEAMDSIFNQDFPHECMAVIFVDDGSTDKTLSIVLDFVLRIDMEAKVIHNEWRGLGWARNVVVNNARGDYIVWVDGDMVLSKDYVKEQVEFMKRNPKVGISLGFVLVPENNWLVKLDLLPALIDRIKFLRQGSPLRRAVTCGAAFRLEALRQVKGFDEKIRGAGEDLEVACRIEAGGWLLGATDARFWERKGDMKTLGQFWKRYFWYDYGNHKVYLKNRKALNIFRMTPLAGALAGILFSVDAYKLTKEKSLFLILLLPASFALKYTAWCLGFTKKPN